MPATDDAAPSGAPDAAFRLPRTVEPRTYRLTIAPDLAAATFTGTVEIDLTVHEPVTEIVCNAAELALAEVSVEGPGGTRLDATVELDEAAERATFRLSDPLGAGEATLRCTFDGVLNDKLRGFYRSTFTDQSGTTRTVATTQMESTDARRAFPCWDEPDRKAVFEVTLVVDEGLAAFSNSPVADEAVEGGTRRVRFAPTMKMSTYLVAFVVGPLEATDPVDVEGVPVRVVHAPGKGNLAPFALEVAAHALRFFTDYFAIAYPGDKVDLVAIPDFAFGAMENLGCVTFRETALLIDPATAARTELERVALVVAHELAHMWFGDLVTMRWWEGIWLNEAFATFMETLCVDAFRPGWEVWVSFGISREAAMALDDLHSTRPIEYPVGSPAEADGMFDLLTYEKGCSVLRMLEQFLGPDRFRDGVRAYLTAHAYANTVTADLWDALESVSGEPVRAVMDSWILQGGHPLVTVGPDAVTQEPFAYGPAPAGAPSAIGDRWQVPVLVRTLHGERVPPGATERHLLGPDPVPIPPPPADGGARVVNAGGWGAYRTAYGPGELVELVGRLADLATLERFNLLADTWALVLADRAGPGALLDLAAGLGDDGDPSTWALVVGALTLCDRVVAAADRPALQAAVRSLLGPRFERLGWDPGAGEGERAPSLRALLLQALGTVGADPAVRAEAARRFDGTGGGPIAPDIESAVLQAVAAQLRPGDYEAVYARYRDPATPQEELRYLNALAAFPDADLAVRTFELCRSDEVRTQNAPYLVAVLLANRVGGPAVWERVKSNWDELLARFPVNSHSRMVEGAKALCGQRSTSDDVTRFLTEHPVAHSERTVVQMLERLAVNTGFGERNRPQLGAVLAGAGGAAGADRP
jgi:puromycin-sensitive aminopeptidase